jgi:hypothetical protein
MFHVTIVSFSYETSTVEDGTIAGGPTPAHHGPDLRRSFSSPVNRHEMEPPDDGCKHVSGGISSVRRWLLTQAIVADKVGSRTPNTRFLARATVLLSLVRCVHADEPCVVQKLYCSC